MTDLETFLDLLKKADSDVAVNPEAGEEYAEDARGGTVVRVLPGFRAHFEATFDAAGSIKSVGQWEDM